MNPAQPDINNYQESHPSKNDKALENQPVKSLPVSNVSVPQLSNRPLAPLIKPKLSLRDALYNSSTPQAINFSPAFTNQLISRQPSGIHTQNTTSLTSRVSGLLPIIPQSQTSVSLPSQSNTLLAKRPLVNLLPNDNGATIRTPILPTPNDPSQAVCQNSQSNNSTANTYKNITTSYLQTNSDSSRINVDSSLPFKKRAKKNNYGLQEKVNSHSSLASASQQNLSLIKDESLKTSTSSSFLAPKANPVTQPLDNKKSHRTIEEINLSQTVKERVLKHLKDDQEKSTNPDYLRPFDSFNDAFSRLLPYHLFQYNSAFFEKNSSDEQRSSKLLQARSVLYNRLSQISKRSVQEKQFPSSLSTLINHLLVSDATTSQVSSKSLIVKNEHSSTAPTPQPTDRLSSIAPSESYF